MESYLWVVWLAVAAIGLMRLSSILSSVRSTEAMTKRLLINNKIEWGVAAEPSLLVKELAECSGSEVSAIKAYREQTGLGFKEARQVIRKLQSSK